MHAGDIVRGGVLFRHAHRRRIEVAGLHFPCTEDARSECKDSAAGAEIERVPFRAAQLVRDIRDHAQARRGRRMFAGAECDGRRDEQRGSFRVLLTCEREFLFGRDDEQPAAHAQRRARLWLEFLAREGPRHTQRAAECAHERIRLGTRDVIRLDAQRARIWQREHHEPLPEPAEAFHPCVLPFHGRELAPHEARRLSVAADRRRRAGNLRGTPGFHQNHAVTPLASPLNVKRWTLDVGCFCPPQARCESGRAFIIRGAAARGLTSNIQRSTAQRPFIFVTASS